MEFAIEQNFKIGNNNCESLDVYISEVYDRISKKSDALASINPLAILGFSIGEPLKFKLYEDIGFNHPKKHSYYELKFDENGQPSGDPKMVDIYEGIKASGKIDDPILVYPIMENGIPKIIALDGATRLTCISYIISRNPESDIFSRVKINVFNGDADAAYAEMTRRNLDERNRSLTDIELMNSIYSFINKGWTKDQISSRLGKDPIKWRPILDGYIAMGNNLIEPLKKALEEGKIARSAAFEAARVSQEEQEAIAEIVNGGTEVKAADLKKKNAENKKMRPGQTLKTISEKFATDSELANFLASKRLKSKYADSMKEIQTRILALRDEIENDLNPKKEEK